MQSLKSHATTTLGRSNKLQDKLQSTLLNKLQNTEYVDNDVDVNDVDDDEQVAGAYLFCQTQRWSYQLTTTLSILHKVLLQLTLICVA